MTALQLATVRQRERLLMAAYGGCVALMVALPVYAWQVVLYAAAGESLSRIAAPLWFLLAESALAWVVGRVGRDWGRVPQIAVGIVPVALAYTLLALHAPGALSDGDIVSAIALPWQLLASGPIASPTSYFLLALVALVWALGVGDGAATRAFRQSRALGRVAASLGATLLASGVVVGVPAGRQGETVASLMVALTLVIFAGLLLLALTHGFHEREMPGVDPIFLATQGRQFGWAALVAACVALVALTITFAASPQNIIAFLTTIGVWPIIMAIVDAFKALLAWLGGGLGTPIFKPTPGELGLPTPPGLPFCKLHPRDPRCLKISHTPLGWLMVLLWLLGVVICVVVIMVVAREVARTLRNRSTRAPGDDPEEERESLGGWQTLRAQLRAMLRRSAPRDTSGLTGVRALYADLLRRAAARGMPRRLDQTPREYASALRTALPLADGADDLDALSDAYSEARYAEREPANERLAWLRERARRLRGALARRAPG